MDHVSEMFGARELAACVPTNLTSKSLTTPGLWSWQGWYTIFDIFFLFVALFFELVPVEFAMVAAVLMLGAAQIILSTDMISGFSSTGVIAVATLFVLAEGLTSTGAIDFFMGKLLGNPKSLGQALMRMMVPSAFVAAWISSTAVIALMIPIVSRWARKIKIPPSQLMMPLCYAVHLGELTTTRRKIVKN